MRDFLLSPGAGGSADPARGYPVHSEADASRALDRYARTLDPEEQDTFPALRSEIDEWWQVLQTAFQWTPAERERLRYTFFYEQLVPRRTTMLQIADRIAEINERGLNRAEERLAASAENLRWSLLVTFGIALLGGRRCSRSARSRLTLRLEREVERRLKETTEARADLQALSARLVRAQEEERRTLARELHDEVGQSLSAIMMEAGNAEAAPRTPGEIRRARLIHRIDRGKDTERGARPRAAASPFHAGRFRSRARAQLACPRDEQTNRPQRSRIRGSRPRTIFRTSTRPASTGWSRRR